MNLTTKQITFLRDIHSSINVDKTSGWRYHYFDGLSVYEISTFIKLIGDDKIYLLIPIFANSNSWSHATLNLSRPFLVNNKSNSDLNINSIIINEMKLPISMNPLEYGKLVRRFNNVYHIQLNEKNYVYITQLDDHNEIEFYRSGKLV